MFESLSATELIEQMSLSTRAESAAIAERLACIAQLDAQRTVELSETVFWRTDPFDEVCAEISAALSISRHRAGYQVREARALAKLPLVAAMFHRGEIDYRIVREILYRTVILNAGARSAVDEALARHASRWLNLSDKKLRDRIDKTIADHDPDGVRVPPPVQESRYIEIQPSNPGMVDLTGRLRAEDGATLDARLDSLARTVCDADPRTHAQRRSDAAAALSRFEQRLQCLCANPDCPAATEQSSATNVVLHVFAEQSTLDGTSNHPGYLPGVGIQPAETIRTIAAKPQTTITAVTLPPDQAEPRYRPSTSLADFVRWRDLTCRWPGCDQPALTTDIDHTTPWPHGPTHASNTKAYCRAHHLVKTFCPGWTDRQYSDGTIELTAPTGHVYRSQAHGAALFPDLATPTGDLPEPHLPEPTGNRAAMMPRRQRTRAQDQQQRIDAERRQRHQLNEATERQRQQWLDDHAEPPPF